MIALLCRGSTATELHHCSGSYRITPTDVNSRQSSCLTNFLLSGRSVMLEMVKRTSNTKIISHMLTSHGGEIFIHTLSEFSHYGDGESSYYAMSALKNMVGSKSFMEFPDAVKKCQVEKMEKCLSDHFFEKVQDQCECLPWRLATFNTKFNISVWCSLRRKFEFIVNSPFSVPIFCYCDYD